MTDPDLLDHLADIEATPDDTGRPGTRMIRAADLAVKDVVIFLGVPHVISRIDPYTGPVTDITAIAYDATGWGIALSPNVPLHIAEERP